MKRAIVAAFASLLVLPSAGRAQQCISSAPLPTPSGIQRDARTMAAMADSAVDALPLLLRPSSIGSARVCDPLLNDFLAQPGARVIGGVELGAAPVTPALEYNSAYPRDRYNGTRWAGRGMSNSLSLGATAQWRFLSAALRPVVAYQQNDEFRTVAVREPGHSPLIYPWADGRIDWPQRFGNESFTVLDLGPSFVRADFGAFAAGVSNENLWWGPAERYPLLLSDNAPGFAHAFVGTGSPVRVLAGEWSGELLWGRLEESDYFDADAANDVRLFSAIGLTYTPSFVPGLTAGAARTYSTYAAPGRLDPLDYVVQPFTDATRNRQGRDGEDQMLALYMLWHLPQAGFRVWAEWGRADFWDGARDLVGEPEHTQAYTLGLSKLLDLDGSAVRVLAELTDLERSSTELSGRPTPVIYTNGSIRQGHTHRGQLLGAPIGPGSNAQVLAADWITEWGVLGAELERARYDASSYYPRFAEAFGFHGHDIEVTGALRYAYASERWDVSTRLSYSHRENRGFATLEDIILQGFDFRFPIDRNVGLLVELSWKPSLGILPR